MTTTLAHPPAPSGSTHFPPAAGYPRAHRVRIVTIPDRSCLAIAGVAAPGGPDSEAAMGALYATAYSLTSGDGTLMCLRKTSRGSVVFTRTASVSAESKVG